MNRILIITLTLLTGALQAAPTQQEIVGQLKKCIIAADLQSFEKTFDAHKSAVMDSFPELAQLARVTRAKVQADVDAQGNHTGNAPTFLKGLGQGVVGLWALFNTGILGVMVHSGPQNRAQNLTVLNTLSFPTVLLLPMSRTIFLFLQSTKRPDDGSSRKIVFDLNPPLHQQLPRLWAGYAVTGITFSALTAYTLYKAGVNLSRGLNYKKYLTNKLHNLDIIIEHLT